MQMCMHILANDNSPLNKVLMPSDFLNLKVSMPQTMKLKLMVLGLCLCTEHLYKLTFAIELSQLNAFLLRLKSSLMFNLTPSTNN